MENLYFRINSINNQIMKTLLMLMIAYMATINIMLAQSTNKEIINFDKNKFDLTEDAQNQLKQIINKVYSTVELIKIEGHTDSDGSIDNNQTLSKKRALSVYDFFVSNGIKKSKIKIDHFGESNPIASNDNDLGKRINRRVEIILEYKALIVTDIFTNFRKESQVFKFPVDKLIVIKGKEGTIIRIPANSLVTLSGKKVTGEIDIMLNEYYTKSDIVLANLNTMSDNKLLETAGMINVEAKKDNEELKLRRGSEMTIEFKSDEELNEMEIFLGEKNNDQMNWVQQDTSVIIPIEPTDIISGFPQIIMSGVNDTVEYANLKKVNNLIFKTTTLGWINCDRFYNYKNKTDLIVQIDTTYKPVLMLVFRNINSIMPGYYSNDNMVIFHELPVGLRATLIGLSMVNDEPYFASKDIEIRKNHKENLELIQTTISELKNELVKLN